VKAKPTYQKLRGGYYTPGPIAEFLCDWAIRSSSDTVLEPSCGDGVFLRTAAARLTILGANSKGVGLQITGVEIDPIEARKAAGELESFGVDIHENAVRAGDFFSWAHRSLRPESFDVVIGNPPFVRYQSFPEEQRELAFRLMTDAGLRPNRLTNIWVPFVVAAAGAVKEGGRLAFVLPAELLQVTYASQLREFLTRYFSQVTVVTFSKLTFDSIQQEIVLLLANRASTERRGIEVIELSDITRLTSLDSRKFGSDGFKTVDHSAEKWTKYFLNQYEIDLLRELRSDKRLTRLGDLADADIGVVTGANDIFVLSGDAARQNDLLKFSRRIVARSGHMPGIVFRDADWNENVRSGHRAYLLDLPPVDVRMLPSAVRQYLAQAEKSGVHKGYKCRIRKFWHTVPSVYDPHAFLLRQIHLYPKLVVNRAKTTCTDTIHRVNFKNGVDRESVAAAFLNSLTFAFAEILGRSYGGGVLELEPNEADSLPLPLQGSQVLDAKRLDNLMRNSEIDTILRENDAILLRKNLGLSVKQCTALNSIWKKLSDRRISRRRTATR
jgi:adenine-specific DNA-methyltransferase